MKIKKERIILAIIILALILYIVLRKQDRIYYQLPEVPQISQAEISRIEISKPDGSIVIEKKDDKWIIGLQEYLADQYSVESMLDSIEKPMLTAIVSDSKTYTRYGLDDNEKITVRIFSGESLRREIELGNLTNSRQHTFIKLDNDHRVYHAKDNLRSLFNKDIDELRDKIVLSFEKSEIKEIGITKEDRSIFLTLTEQVSTEEIGDKEAEIEDSSLQEKIRLWKTPEGKYVEASLPEGLLSSLFRLSCKEYLYDTRKEDLINPMCTIRLKDAKEYILSIFPKKDDSDQGYSATSSENDSAFILSDWRVEDILETADKILKSSEES